MLLSLFVLNASIGKVLGGTFEQKCLSFTPETLVTNSTRTQLQFVKNGTILEFPDNVASCARPNQTVHADICRIALYIPTSPRSGITFELWLPEKWQGQRLIATGNGGIDGCKCI